MYVNIDDEAASERAAERKKLKYHSLVESVGLNVKN
jgi:hypothetical protein